MLLISRRSIYVLLPSMNSAIPAMFIAIAPKK